MTFAGANLLATACLLAALSLPSRAEQVAVPLPSAAAGTQTPEPAVGAIPEQQPAAESTPARPDDPERGEFVTPSPIPVGFGFLVGGSLDVRGRTSAGGLRERIWINTGELQIQHPVTTNRVAHGNVKVQVIFEDPVDIPEGRDIQLGEAYVLYKLPLRSGAASSAYLKVGQFQLPFALLAEYDPHLDLVQPLYAQSIGLRNDWGIAVSGRFYGLLTYDLSVTTGAGPNRADIDPNRLICFRLGRTFVTRNGIVNVGGSLLSGRLPVTNIDSSHPFANELPPSGRIRTVRGPQFTEKTRIAGDGTYTYKNVTGRGEIMTGADDDDRVFGFFLYGAYRFSPRASAILSRSFWVYSLGGASSTRDAAGVTMDMGRNVGLSALLERLRDVPEGMSGRYRSRLTTQLLVRF
jgi:hypothetical protein